MSLLRKNIATLLAWQATTNLLPLITFSYLTRTLNPEGFGLLSFTQGIIAYAVLLADWGFGISASQQVARQQHDAAAISRIFWDTMLAKVLLVLVSLLLLLLVLVLIPRLRAQMDLLLVMWLLAPAAVFMPAWLLQGLEKMGGFATSSVLGSICTIPLIFWLVQGLGDVLLAGLIQVLASTISAAVGLVGVYRLGVIRWRRPSVLGAFEQIRQGGHVFMASAAITFYTTSNTVILGAVAGVREVGMFTGADKLRTAAQGLLNPLSMAVFPRANAVMAQSQEKGMALLRNVLWIQGSVGVLISLALWVVAEWLLPMILGAGYEDARLVLRWLAIIPTMIALNNVFGMQVMLALGRQRAFTRILVTSSMLNMLLVFPLASWYGAAGVAATMALVEVFVTLVMAAYIVHTGIPLFRRLG